MQRGRTWKKGGRKPKKSLEEKPLNNPIKTPNENENENDTIKKEIYKEKDLTIELNGQRKSVLAHLFDFMQTMLSDQLFIERLCMNNNLNQNQLSDYLKQFIILRSDENNTEIQSVVDAQRYFGRWLHTQIGKQTSDKTKTHESELHPALR